MTSFGPQPTYFALSGSERLRRAYERGSPFWETFEQNVGAGIESSFGLGTMLRELTTPGLLTDTPQRGDTPENYATRVQRFKDEALSEEQYKESPSYRTAIPWQRGMTEARAAALARNWDKQQVAAAMANKNMVAGFAGQFVGQMFDPINYIPVFNGAAHAAAVAKAGSILGRAGMASAEAAINTAAFGLMTAGIRRNFGDDVSFQGIMNEIAMSALIGGAFGAGIGVLARGRDARVRNAISSARVEMDDIRNKVRSRETLARAASDIIDKGYVDFGPENVGNIQDTARQVEARTIGVRQLEKETADVQGDQPGQVVISPSGYRINVQPRIVELGSLNHANGGLQVRDRSRTASARWVEETATRLDPALLRADISSDRGAPLVGDDMTIDSGNGRVMAIRRAYEAYPDRIEAYRADLEAQGYDLSGFNQPVLVMERTTPLSPEARAAFNADSNGRVAAEMSATEIADMDAAAMTDDMLAIVQPGGMASRDNAAFVSRFINNLPRNERGAFIDKDGNINADGLRRIENALISAAYGTADPLVIRRFTEATDDNSRAILGAMADVAPQWARIQRSIRRGDIDPDYDPAPALTDAVRLLNRFRAQAASEKRPVSTVIREGLAQLDMLRTENLPARRMLEAFFDSDQFTKALGRNVISAYLDRIAANVEALGQPQLFGRPDVSMQEVIENASASEQANIRVTASDLGLSSSSLSAIREFEIDAGLEEGGSRSIFEGTEGAAREETVNADQGRIGRGSAGSAGVPEAAPRARSWRQGREGDGSLRGLPRKVGTYTASVFTKAQEVAVSYMKKAGLDYQPPSTYAKVDPLRAGRIADAYDRMAHNPGDPEVRAAYDAMARETLAQYEAMIDAGIKIEFMPPGKDMYEGNPRNMTEDVRKNNHMWVFPTVEGFGSDATVDVLDNPLLADSGFKFGDKPATVNDVFRAVHDYFGHVKEGVGFRADGEENAWRSHSAMYSPLARRAMTSETRGQNSWVNYGPYGESNRSAKSEDTHYADQKVGLLPDWVITEGAGDAIDPVTGIDTTVWQSQIAQQQQAFAGSKAKTADHSSLNDALDMAGYNDLFASSEKPLTPDEIHAMWDDRIATARAGGNEKRAKSLERTRDEQLRLAEIGANKPDAEEIFKKTGWFQGVDGKWRFEIDDRGAKIKHGVFREIAHWAREGHPGLFVNAKAQGKNPYTIRSTEPNNTLLSEVLDHPKLFEAYPQLRQTTVQLITDPAGPKIKGYYDPDNNFIMLTAHNTKELRSGLLHEIQHIIQTGENWASGGAPGTAGEVYDGKYVEQARAVAKNIDDEFSEVMDTLRKMKEAGEPAEKIRPIQDRATQLSVMSRKAADQITRAAQHEAYERLAGEVEARNVEARAALVEMKPDSELPPPWATMDRPAEVQVVTTIGVGRRWKEIAGEGELDSPGELTQTELDLLMAAAEAGDTDAIVASPMLKDVVKTMMEIPETRHVDGYGSVEWSRQRTYIGSDGETITGVVNAVNHLIDNAKRLAADELGIAPYPIAPERKAVIVVGPPAAGKSTVANQIAARLRAAIPDADEAKKIMPEYGTGLGANATHEESALLSELVMQELVQEGSNVVIPKVGGKRDSIDGLSSYLKENGYKVDVVLMDVPKAEAFRRMVNRFRSTGRLIPPQYFNEIADKPREVFKELRANGKQDGHGTIASDRGVPPFVRDGAFAVLDYQAGAKVIEIAPRPRGDGGSAEPRPVYSSRQASLDLIGGEVKPVQAKPDPIPEGLPEAEAKVGKPGTTDEMAEEFDIDPETGNSPETDTTAQMKKEGRLSPQDEAELAAAEQNFKNAKAYANALDAARACVI